jgi:hypothetical protein
LIIKNLLARGTLYCVKMALGVGTPTAKHSKNYNIKIK